MQLSAEKERAQSPYGKENRTQINIVTLLRRIWFPSSAAPIRALISIFMTETQHTSKYTKNWLNKQRIKHNYLPTNSPDLNPIEWLWWRLDARVQSHNPSTFEEYKHWIIYEWDNITMEEVNSVIDHVHNLLPQIQAARGGIVMQARKQTVQ